MINGLDLFSGIGGISLALAPWVRPIAYCENERYAQAELMSRMRSLDLPCAPIWDDVRTLRGEEITKAIGSVDIIYGGFPCQDISESGAGAGLGGERSGLFWQVMRLADELKPKFLFLENVRNIRSKGLGEVATALAARGYDCRWDILPAYDDRRYFEGERWFCLAKAQGFEREAGRAGLGDAQASTQRSSSLPSPLWDPNADPMAGEADGLPYRVDRLRGLGNAVVPAQAREAFQRLMGLT